MSQSTRRIVVNGAGRKPNDVMIVGEAPGKEEAYRGRPFVGKSGQEQDWYLLKHDLHSATMYKTNVVKEYRDGNPDPTPTQVNEWTPVLESEITEVQPSVIIAVGRFAARWFLGNETDMDMVHGLPHLAGAFDRSRTERSQGAVVVPVFHPAGGLYDGGMREVIDRDYTGAAGVINSVRREEELDVLGDWGTDSEDVNPAHYADADGDTVARWLNRYPPRVLAIDTEGTPDSPWSIQLSDHEGYGTVLRYSRPDFAVGAAAIQKVVDSGALIVTHDASTPMGCCYDTLMCRAMGIELSHARMFNTMYAAYLLRQSQGLKTLAWRYLGLRMENYQKLVSDAALDKQVEYLIAVSEGGWAKPEPRLVHDNDGTSRLYQPQKVQKRAEKILVDHFADKRDKDDNPVDVESRWFQIDRQTREVAEGDLGGFPRSSLDDIPINDAIRYAAMDADATLRLYQTMTVELANMDLSDLMDRGMAVLPVFEEMQRNGLPVRRSKFEELLEEIEDGMCKLQSKISTCYYGGKPFNPASPKQVGALMRRRGLQGTKKTKTGAVSTGKKSIEHLRFTDDAICDVIDWREHQKIRDAFCAPLLERIPEDVEEYTIRSVFKPTRTTARRLALENPNLQQIPVRNELGMRVRECYEAPEGWLLGSADLSQIEMRVAAHESNDRVLCELINNDLDIHAETAARIFGLKVYRNAETAEERYRDVDKMEHRHPSKRAGFGILYGIQEESLLTQLRMMGCKGWTADRCRELIEEWLKIYKGIKEEIERTGKEAERLGYVRDMWGMYRYLPGIRHRDPGVKAEAQRLAFSHRIQGGAQGMMQNSMVWLHKEVKGLREGGVEVKECLQIHDDEVVMFKEEWEELVEVTVLEALTEHSGAVLRVPVKADWKSARTWAGLK